MYQAQNVVQKNRASTDYVLVHVIVARMPIAKCITIIRVVFVSLAIMEILNKAARKVNIYFWFSY